MTNRKVAGSWLVADSEIAKIRASGSDNQIIPIRAIDKFTWDRKGNSNLVLGDLAANAYYGDKGKTAYDYSQALHTMYIGTTQVATNRASAALTLAGITLTTPNIGVATATSLDIGDVTNGATISLAGVLQSRGTGDYWVAGNRYAFRYSGDTNFGLFFNETNLRYEFRVTGAVDIFHITTAGTVYAAGDITLSGSVGATGARATKVWTADIESTNMPTVGGTSLSTTFAGIKQTISLLAQTAAIGTTAIAGTNTAGLYRVHYYLEDTTADLAAGTIMVNFAYTDDAGVTTLSSVALPLTALGRTQGTLFIRVLGTGSINYSTTLVGLIGTSQYALFCSAEKIL